MFRQKWDHDHLHKDHQGGDNFYKGLVLGAAVAAAVVWLFGTEKGKKIRRELHSDTDEWLKYAREFLDEEAPYEPSRRPAAKKETPGAETPLAVTTPTRRFFRRKKLF